jgi:hypothetical protein
MKTLGEAQTVFKKRAFTIYKREQNKRWEGMHKRRGRETLDIYLDWITTLTLMLLDRKQSSSSSSFVLKLNSRSAHSTELTVKSSTIVYCCFYCHSSLNSMSKPFGIIVLFQWDRV